MQSSIKTFTVAMGRDLPAARNLGFPCADLICTVHRGALQLTGRPSGHGGLLGFYLTAETHIPALRPITQNLAAIAGRCRCQGILLDLSEDDHGMALAARLSPPLIQMGFDVYLPVTLGAADDRTRLILPSAISGGSLQGMLEHFTNLYSPGRLCLELVRTRHDFPIPSPDPTGILLSAQDFTRLHSTAGQHFFSPHLCANYFTYQDTAGKPRLVLFDNAETARQKLDLARSCGLYAFFALYAEWGQEIGEIFGSVPSNA